MSTNIKGINLTGQRFGTLTVTGIDSEKGPQSQKKWICLCDCGKTRSVIQQSLTSGNTKTCGDHPKNNYIICEGYALIDVSTPTLTNTFTKIDLDDLDRVINFKCPHGGGRLKWMAIKGEWNTYVVATNRKTHLHRFVMGASGPSELVDHCDGDGLDNRKSKLKIVDSKENAKNIRKRRDNTSGYAGVWFSKRNNVWVAEIICDGKKHHLGRFDDARDAGIAYRAAAKVLGFSERHGT